MWSLELPPTSLTQYSNCSIPLVPSVPPPEMMTSTAFGPTTDARVAADPSTAEDLLAREIQDLPAGREGERGAFATDHPIQHLGFRVGTKRGGIDSRSP